MSIESEVAIITSTDCGTINDRLVIDILSYMKYQLLSSIDAYSILNISNNGEGVAVGKNTVFRGVPIDQLLTLGLERFVYKTVLEIIPDGSSGTTNATLLFSEIRDLIPFDIRGKYAPSLMAIRWGHHRYNAVDTFFSIAFSGYSTPNDSTAFEREFVNVPVIRGLCSLLSSRDVIISYAHAYDV